MVLPHWGGAERTFRINRMKPSAFIVFAIVLVRGFDAEPGRATVVALGTWPEVVWQTMSDTGVIDEMLPEALAPP